MWFDTPSPAFPTEILGQGHTLLLKVWSLGLHDLFLEISSEPTCGNYGYFLKA